MLTKVSENCSHVFFYRAFLQGPFFYRDDLEKLDFEIECFLLEKLSEAGSWGNWCCLL